MSLPERRESKTFRRFTQAAWAPPIGVISTSRFNIVLQPGDSLHIPEYTPSVKVAGAVNSPGSVLWRQGANLSYYVSAAGGYAPQALKG